MQSIKIVDFGSSRGRGVITTRQTEAGDVIFSESPLLCCQFSWNRLYGYQACDYCMCPLESAEANAKRLTGNQNLVLPYSDCGALPLNITHCPGCGLAFCSPGCLESARPVYHSLLCENQQNNPTNPVEKLDEIWRQIHFPPETGTIMILVRMACACLSARFLHSPQSQHIASALETFVSCTEVVGSDGGSAQATISHKLLRPEFNDSITQLHRAFVSVLFYLTRKLIHPDAPESECLFHLQQAHLDGLLNIDKFRCALCLLGRNGQGVATSAFSLWVKTAEKLVSSADHSDKAVQFEELVKNLYAAMDDHVGPFLDNEGVGLYQFQSLINHSCDPNAVVKFGGESNRLSVVALRSIALGEEVTISYLDECDQFRSRHSRRKFLSANYLFWCECDKCVTDKAAGALSETSDEEEDSSEEVAME
ncbi:unnamed protein product [Calicophoron daubneyi]|uniref:SET domain-containing protein n=1 Tax=Calicophoron daubneyi TaxID=300641 RepID=A0AAV2TVN4_CALDB